MVRRVVFLTASEQTVVAAAAAFLAQPSLARSTRRSYAQTLTPLMRELGSDRPLSTLTVEAITVAVTTAWGGRAPATWNRQVATVRSFLAFCRRRRWLVEDLTVDLERRPQPADRTKAIPFPELERLGAARTSPCGRRRCGACCMRRPPGPARPWRSTSRILTWTTSACGSAPRAATPTDCTSERFGPAAAAADWRPHPWAAGLGRPASGPGPDAGDGGSLPADRSGSAQLPARRGAVPGGLGRMDPAPAAPFGPHPPGRAEREACRC